MQQVSSPRLAVNHVVAAEQPAGRCAGAYRTLGEGDLIIDYGEPDALRLLDDAPLPAGEVGVVDRAVELEVKPGQIVDDDVGRDPPLSMSPSVNPAIEGFSS